MSINEEITKKIVNAKRKDSRVFQKKLIKSHYGSRPEIIQRAEFMFEEELREMDRHPDNGDPLAAGYVLHILNHRDRAEIINYILTGTPIPER